MDQKRIQNDSKFTFSTQYLDLDRSIESFSLYFQYRPSRWHWRRGEPRYTAASIHM